MFKQLASLSEMLFQPGTRTESLLCNSARVSRKEVQMDVSTSISTCALSFSRPPLLFPSSHHPLSCSQQQFEQRKPPNTETLTTYTKEGMSGCHLRHTSIFIAPNPKRGVRSDQTYSVCRLPARNRNRMVSQGTHSPYGPGWTCLGEEKQRRTKWKRGGGLEGCGASFPSLSSIRQTRKPEKDKTGGKDFHRPSVCQAGSEQCRPENRNTDRNTHSSEHRARKGAARFVAQGVVESHDAGC